MEEPGNLFICSFLLFSTFPSLLACFYICPSLGLLSMCINYAPIARCKRLGAFHVLLFYALIYTDQKKHGMFVCSAPAVHQVQEGRNRMVPSITQSSQLVNNQLVGKKKHSQNMFSSQMCRGGRWSTEQL